MKSLKIVNGDLSFDSTGKMEWVDEDDNSLLIQSINLKLSTRNDDLFYSEIGYGRPELKGKITQDVLEDFLNDTLIDDRIANINVNSFKINERGRVEISISIELVTGEIIEVEEDLEVEV